MANLFEALDLKSGAQLKNRLALAPLTNLQSHPDGRLSDEEFKWLTMRAKGGFGLVMTCATSVSPGGVGFSGQLGAYDDAHVEGLARLATALKADGAHAVVQLHHGGIRAPQTLTGVQPVGPSAEAETGARALSLDEVGQVREDFIAAAVRSQQAGFDGVELHGAHGYLICQFLSAELNTRDDAYGGSFENRTRLLWDIIDGVHANCGPQFSLGVRLSPERFGMRFGEILDLASALLNDQRLDYVDMSLWDVFKQPSETAYKGKGMIEWFGKLPRAGVRLGAAGKIVNGADAARLIEAGADFAFIGTSGILHHDLPKRIAADPAFKPIATPVSVDYLEAEGLAAPFIEYLRTRKMVA